MIFKIRPGTIRSDTLWKPYLAFSILATLGYYAAIATGLPGVRAIIYTTIGLASLAAIIIGIRTKRTNYPDVWVWIFAGLLLYFMGDLIYNYYRFVAHIPRPFPSIADIFFLLSRIPFIAGLLLLARRYKHKQPSTFSILDSLIVASGLALLWWSFLMSPYALNPAIPLLEKTIAIAYPAMDFFLLAASIRLAFAANWTTPTYLLWSALMCLLGADTIYTILQLNHIYSVGTVLDLGWIWFYSFIGLTALYRKTSAPPPIAGTPLSHPRLIVRLTIMTLAALLLPLTLLLSDTFGIGNIGIPAVLIGATLILLAMARLQRLIFDNMALESQLAETKSDTLFRAIVERTHNGVAVFHANGSVKWTNPAIRDMATFHKPHGNIRDAVHPEDLTRFDQSWEKTLASPSGTQLFEYRILSPDNRCLDVETLTINLMDDEWIHGIVNITRDITAAKHHERELQHVAFTDSLTGLPNRAALTMQLREAVDRARAQSQIASIIFLDLNNFREVNDSLGHTRGDQILIQMGTRLATDLHGSGHSVARFGGDEFIVVSGNLRSPEDATALYHRVASVLSRPHSIAGHSIRLTASAGIALSEHGSVPPDELIRNADIALYRAKLDGPGRMVQFAPRLLADNLRRINLASTLRSSLTSGSAAGAELKLLFQPIVRLDDDGLAAADTIVQWRHPALGHISTGELNELTEQIDLQEALAASICDRTGFLLQRWGPALYGMPFRLFTSIGSAALIRPGFETTVLESLQRYKIPPKRVGIAIAENALQRHPGTAQVLSSLANKGVGILIDDFGKEFASLAQLRDIPCASIRVSQSLLQAGTDPKSRTLLKGVITLAHDLGMTVIAKDLRATAQLSLLRELGCDYGQGPLIGEPITSNQFEHNLGLQHLPTDNPAS